MKKDKVLVLILIVLVLMLIAVVLFVSKNHNKTNNSLKNEVNGELTNKGIELINKINKLDDKSIIFIGRDIKNSPADKFKKNIVDYYADVYHFETLEFDLVKYSKRDLDAIYKLIGITERSLPTPVVVLYSKGDVSYIVNYFEADLRKLLVSKEYITDEDFSKDQIIDSDIYDKIGNSEVLVYLSNNYQSYYKYRKYIYNNYHNNIIMYSNIFGCDFDVCKSIKDKINDIDDDVLYLVSNNEIIDYITNIKSESDIVSFLKKHNVL